jgi:hypothetical protein
VLQYIADLSEQGDEISGREGQEARASHRSGGNKPSLFFPDLQCDAKVREEHWQCHIYSPFKKCWCDLLQSEDNAVQADEELGRRRGWLNY